MSRMFRVGIAVAVAVASFAALVIGHSPVDSVTALGCSIADMSQTDGVQIATTPVGTSAAYAGSAEAVSAFQATNPDATILQSSVDVIDAPNVPPIDGHTANVIAFRDDTVTGAGGQAGIQMGQYTVGCGLAFYDADTGEFLAAVKRLDPVSP